MRAIVTRVAAVPAVAPVLGAGRSTCANAAAYAWPNVVLEGGGSVPGVHPALSSRTRIGGVRGIVRTGDAHRYAGTGEAITGDRRVYGRVDVAADGRGVSYGGRVG